MSSKRDTHIFKAAQAAGSCRLEGIRVNKRSQSRMESIIEGTTDSQAIKDRLVRQYRRKNAATLAVAAG